MISLINYHIMKKRIHNLDIPSFSDEHIERWVLLFQGKVKRVAFRNEALLISQRIGLVGYVKNTQQGVLVEVEGSVDRLNYFLKHIKSIDRFIITTYSLDKVALKKEDRFIKNDK